jgi:uncharacterized protein with HEPN domain
MESAYFHNKQLASNILAKMVDSCELILDWNKYVNSVDDYLSTPEGLQKLAATCMLVESIGEGAKKVDKLLPNFLYQYEPEIPWQSVKGMRDHIAHGYFNIDADIIFDVVSNEISRLHKSLRHLLDVLV